MAAQQGFRTANIRTDVVIHIAATLTVAQRGMTLGKSATLVKLKQRLQHLHGNDESV
ncbi:hypothetical protein PGT21_006994 [Puccinia graminis f. sp. tritici]|uniref:Uncharacterized protein n=1 Tax=Puccinia graminis f. sp. tritici TaxID=56615 RepID=A0A5B0M9J6_PUCGR|nr:hypothetical protein PGT21_006994 [Puccinia graminis f. sp. tritici]